MNLPTALNMGKWRKALAGLPNATLTIHLEFGFPANYTVGHARMPTFSNQKEVPVYTHHVTAYVERPNFARMRC